MSDDCLDSKTNAQLFRIRSRARTADIQRRSMMAETVDYHEKTMEVLQDEIEKRAHKDSVKKLNRAENTIVELLRNNAAFQQTIDRLTDAWGQDKDKAMEQAQAILDQATQDIENDHQYKSRCRHWAREQMEPNNDRPVAKPKLAKRKRKP